MSMRGESPERGGSGEGRRGEGGEGAKGKEWTRAVTLAFLIPDPLPLPSVPHFIFSSMAEQTLSQRSAE